MIANFIENKSSDDEDDEHKKVKFTSKHMNSIKSAVDKIN